MPPCLPQKAVWHAGKEAGMHVCIHVHAYMNVGRPACIHTWRQACMPDHGDEHASMSAFISLHVHASMYAGRQAYVHEDKHATQTGGNHAWMHACPSRQSRMLLIPDWLEESARSVPDWPSGQRQLSPNWPLTDCIDDGYKRDLATQPIAWESAKRHYFLCLSIKPHLKKRQTPYNITHNK